MTDDDLRKSCDTSLAKNLLDVIKYREDFNRESSTESRDKFEMSLLTFDEKISDINNELRRLRQLTMGLGVCR